MPHCWKDYRQHLEEIGQIYSGEWVETYYEGNKTCLLELGHASDHEFVDDNSIEVRVKAED